MSDYHVAAYRCDSGYVTAGECEHGPDCAFTRTITATSQIEAQDTFQAMYPGSIIVVCEEINA